MPIEIGQCRTAPATGISARAWTGFVLRGAYAGVLPSAYTPGTAPRDALAAILESCATAIYETIKVDAVFSVTIPADSLAPGVPATDQTFTVTVT